jgi:hypothetical protein
MARSSANATPDMWIREIAAPPHWTLHKASKSLRMLRRSGVSIEPRESSNEIRGKHKSGEALWAGNFQTAFCT